MKTKKDFKKTEWATPNHMRFDSGYRTFDRQVDYISTGNVISNVQHSSIIRPYSDTNGGVCAKGQCRRFDIDSMSSTRRIPEAISEWLAKHPEEKVWLYNFHFRNTNAGRGENVGWILTDCEHKKAIMSVHCSGRGENWLKRKAVLDEAVKYVVKRNWEG